MAMKPAEGNNKAVSARINMAANKNPTTLLTATLCTLIFQYSVIKDMTKLVIEIVSMAIIKKLPHPNRPLIITLIAM